MGYYTRFDGEIRIAPPLAWGEVKGSPWLSDDHGDLMLSLVEEDVTAETDEGTSVFTRKSVNAISPVTDDSYKGYDIVTHLQKIIDAFPGHTFTGYISAEGEEAGDLWRLAVKDGRAVKVMPRIVWPDEADES
jgi:hypothetical protein